CPLKKFFVVIRDQTVSGRIKIVNTSVKQIRGLEVICKGEAFTSWQRRSLKLKAGQYVHKKKNFLMYEGKEKYFRYKYFLLGGKGQEIELPPGDHFYTFTFVLPSDLPPSFEHSKGYIRYSLKARLVRPWKPDQIASKVITLANNFDLNSVPTLREPKSVKNEQTVGYFCFASGIVSLTISTPQTGYVSGEKMTVACEVENESSVKVQGIRFYLKQLLHFSATYPFKETERKELKLAKKIRRCQILAGEVDKFQTNITVPEVAPSNLSRCSIIDLKYELEVVVNLGSFHNELTATIPITIGSVPLAQGSNSNPTAPELNAQSLTSVLSWLSVLATPLLSKNGQQTYFSSDVLECPQNPKAPSEFNSYSTCSYPAIANQSPSTLMSCMESGCSISKPNNDTCQNLLESVSTLKTT
ncbi:arrestin domain-containing protein 17-like, partial [Agrilus planipennis]|uniref:Arrestin domain-containing protein 17-like n=1 Tax=Agrilus planipennis TaxID=224129 RepID=A0A7F5R9N2_AGRPL